MKMRISKKVVILGPAGTGKTTLKKIFFDMVSPLELLEKSLEPTKGVDTNMYSFFNLDFAMFDLAGQENDNWFDKEKEIFNNSNVIMCVLDINSYLKEILNFLKALITLYNEIKINDSEIIVLLHKIDLIDGLYLQHKTKAINEFLKKQNKKNFKITTHTTSIARQFFFKTYKIIANIILNISDQKTLLKSAFQNYKNDLEIILRYDIEKKYDIRALFLDLNLSKNDAIFHLKRLEKLGFAKLEENQISFRLTQRVRFFNSGFELNKKEHDINKILEMFLIFSNLTQK